MKSGPECFTCDGSITNKQDVCSLYVNFFVLYCMLHHIAIVGPCACKYYNAQTL